MRSFISCCLLTIAFFLASLLPLQAQCWGNPQGGGVVCSGTPITFSASQPCSNCSYTWWTGGLLSGQGTNLAQYLFSNVGMTNGYGMTRLDIYDSLNNCYYNDIWEIVIGSEPNCTLPVLNNGPWDGDTAKIWYYTRSRIQSNSNTGSYEYYPTWTVLNGNLVQVNTQTNNSPFGIFAEDTLAIKWNGGGPLRIKETRHTSHVNTPIFGYDFNCNWDSLHGQMLAPPVNIFNLAYCLSSPVTFYTFPYSNATFSWSISNGTILSGQGTNSIVANMAGSGVVTLSVDTSGTPVVVNKSVSPIATGSVLGPDQDLCQGSSLVLDPGPGFSNYAWSNGASSQTITVTAGGSYSVTATVANSSCVLTDTIVVNLIPATPLNLGPNINACSFPVTINAQSGYSTYLWTSGATSTSINAVVPGIYGLVVTDPNGCQFSDSVYVFDRAVEVNLGLDRNFCSNAPYSVSSNATNATTYLWSNGATTSSTTVIGLGQQTLWVQGSNSFGCSDTDTVVLSGLVTPAPNLGLDDTVCPGTSVVLDAGAGYATYFWNAGLGNQQTASTSNAGSFSVIVWDTNGCFGTDTVNVLNHPHTPVDLGPDIVVCQSSATLDAGPGYASYLWSTGDVSQSITVTQPGQYAVAVTDTIVCGSSDTIDVQFNTFSFDLGNDTTICEPSVQVLNPNLTGTISYLWSNGSTASSQQLSAPGNYQVWLQASNSFGCSFVDTIDVTIQAAPAIFLGNDTILCRDTSIVLDAGPNLAAYLWSNGGTGQQIIVNNGGQFSVVGTYANGCQRTDNIGITALVDCVFPGDVNYDGNADLADAIALGTVIGQQGILRANPSTNWYGQRANNWTTNISNGVNTKHADTDGDRYITLQDTFAISQNFGLSHNKSVGTAVGTGQIRIEPLNSPVQAGGLAVFGVFLEGDAGAALDSVYGLSMDLSWTTGITGPELRSVVGDAAWFAPLGQQLRLSKFSPGSSNLAISRINGLDTAGSGLVFRLEFLIDSNYPPGSFYTFAPVVANATRYSMDLNEVLLSTQVQPVTILSPTAVDPRIVRHIRIYPIPADNLLNIEIEGKTAERLVLVDMLGRTVYEEDFKGRDAVSVDTRMLPAGQYGLQLQFKDRILSRKVIIGH